MEYYRGVAFEPDETGVAERVLCPLVDVMIDSIDCLENQDVIESSIPDRFKRKDDWKDICEKCPFRDY